MRQKEFIYVAQWSLYRNSISSPRTVIHSEPSQLHSFFCVRTSEMFDVGDLPVLTAGNWVIKGWVIKWPVKLYVRF